MITKKYILIIPSIISIFAIGCYTKPSDDATYNMRLTEAGSITIKIDSTTPNYSNYFDIYKQNGKEYLVWGNHQKRTIQFYDLETTTKVKEIPLQEYGPDGIGGLYGFLVRSLDSIYILNNYFYKVFLVNDTGHILNQYSLLATGKENRINNPRQLDISTSLAQGGLGCPLIIRNDTLYMVGIPDGDPFTNQFYADGKVNVWLDLKSSKHGFNSHYPKIYLKKNYSYLAPRISRCYANGIFVLSYGADNNIYVTKYFKSFRSFPAGSNSFKYPAPIRRPLEKTDQHAFTSKYKTASFYFQILYDSYRKVYYRVALVGNENEKNVAFEKKAISIIILNKNFKIIGETLLKPEIYLYKNIFVSKKGLYISTANPYNPSNNENKITFKIFRLLKED